MKQELSVTQPKSSYRHFTYALDEPSLCGAKPHKGWVETELGSLLQCDKCTRKLFGRMN